MRFGDGCRVEVERDALGVGVHRMWIRSTDPDEWVWRQEWCEWDGATLIEAADDAHGRLHSAIEARGTE